MDAHNRLQCVERVFGRCLVVVNVCFGDNVVLLVAADKVDMLLTVVVDCGLQAQVVIDSVVELLAEIRFFFDKFLKHRRFQLKES